MRLWWRQPEIEEGRAVIAEGNLDLLHCNSNNLNLHRYLRLIERILNKKVNFR